jgi:hypothetical protein
MNASSTITSANDGGVDVPRATATEPLAVHVPTLGTIGDSEPSYWADSATEASLRRVNRR